MQHVAETVFEELIVPSARSWLGKACLRENAALLVTIRLMRKGSVHFPHTPEPGSLSGRCVGGSVVGGWRWLIGRDLASLQLPRECGS